MEHNAMNFSYTIHSDIEALRQFTAILGPFHKYGSFLFHGCALYQFTIYLYRLRRASLPRKSADAPVA